MAATHRDMCRFSSSKNDTYKTFVRSIKEIMRVGEGIQVKNEFFEVSLTLLGANLPILDYLRVLYS